jgi:hypothetical protein
MKIFLSYPSEERAIAERLNYALLSQGHDVFFDRDDLSAAHEYDLAIAEAVRESDLFVFLITPSSIETGSYTRTELRVAEQKWPHPAGRVLPVVLRETPIETVPAYLRAVNFLVPHGDVVAETAHEVQRLAEALSLPQRVSRHVRSKPAIAGLVVILMIGVAITMAIAQGIGPFARFASNDSTDVNTPATVRPLPEDVRHRARGVASISDGGFVIAANAPAQLLRFSPEGVRVGEPIAFKGEPVNFVRAPTQIALITRVPDGVTIWDHGDLHVVDTVWLDPASVTAPPDAPSLPRLSGDIRSVAFAGGMPWVVTGDRAGESAVLRFRTPERRWVLPTWAGRTEGIVGSDAHGLVLHPFKDGLWAVTTETRPSSLYHFMGFVRVDIFSGHELQMLSCAHDLAASSAGNLLLLSCDNELLEIQAEGKELRLISTRTTLPSEAGPGNWTYDIIVPADKSVVIALNTELIQPLRPQRARIAEIDSAGSVKTLLDNPDAVVHSLAVTPRFVIAVLRLVSGQFDTLLLDRTALLRQ